MKEFYAADQALVNPPIEETLEFAIEDFFTLAKYTPDRLLKVLEIGAHLLFFATVEAKKARRGFAKKEDVAASEIKAVKVAKCSAKFMHEQTKLRKATLIDVRDEMAMTRLFDISNSASQFQGIDRKTGKAKHRSDITNFFNIKYVALAQFIRRVFAAIVQRAGFDFLERDHKWADLARTVYTLTGCSLFTLNDDYEPTEEARQHRKGEEMAQSIAELANCQHGGAEYRALVSNRLAQQFGPDWPDLLPF